MKNEIWAIIVILVLLIIILFYFFTQIEKLKKQYNELEFRTQSLETEVGFLKS